MRSVDSTGDECPGGKVVFHTSWLSPSKRMGRAEVSATPEPLGPRNRDHAVDRSRSPEESDEARWPPLAVGVIDSTSPSASAAVMSLLNPGDQRAEAELTQ